MPALRGFDLLETVNGYPVYLGTLDVSTTSKTNAQATTTFNTSGELLKGKVLLIQNAGSVDVRVAPVETSSGTVSNTRGTGFAPSIAPGERVIMRLGDAKGYLAAIATSGAGLNNVDVWELV